MIATRSSGRWPAAFRACYYFEVIPGSFDLSKQQKKMLPNSQQHAGVLSTSSYLSALNSYPQTGRYRYILEQQLLVIHNTVVILYAGAALCRRAPGSGPLSCVHQRRAMSSDQLNSSYTYLYMCSLQRAHASMQSCIHAYHNLIMKLLTFCLVGIKYCFCHTRICIKPGLGCLW